MIELSVPPDLELVRSLLEKGVPSKDASGFDRVFMFSVYELGEVFGLGSEKLAALLRSKEGTTRLSLRLLRVHPPRRVPDAEEIERFGEALRAARLDEEPLIDAIYRRLEAEAERLLKLEAVIQTKLERAVEGNLQEAMAMVTDVDQMDAEDLRLLVRLLARRQAGAGRPSYRNRDVRMALEYGLMRVVGAHNVALGQGPMAVEGAASPAKKASREEVIEALADHYSLSSEGVEKALASGNKQLAAEQSREDR